MPCSIDKFSFLGNNNNPLKNNMSDTIKEIENKSLVKETNGIGVMKEAIAKLRHGHDLMEFMKKYLRWSRSFDAPVHCLTARVGIFETRERLRSRADQTIDGLLLSPTREIAEFISLAASDEAGDPAKNEPPHRILALGTFEGILRRYGTLSRDRNDPPEIMEVRAVPQDDEMDEIEDLIIRGYGHEQPLDEEHLLENIGFHLASETLAQEEFKALLELFENWNLLGHLRATKVQVGRHTVQPSLWLEIHGKSEAAHAKAALDAANLFMQHHHLQPHSIGIFIKGFNKMGQLHNRFFTHVAQGSGTAIY